jgi:chemotaxis signal transduction protein
MPPARTDSGLLTRPLAASDAPPPAAPDGAGGPVAPGVRAASYALFRQAGHAYLLPATSVLGVVSAEHIRPLSAPVAGWAGTLTVQRRDGAGGEAAVPVLDATALLGHGGAAGAVLLLRTAGGPLGLAVQQVDRVHGLPGQAVPLGGAPGLAGALVTADGVWLLLDPAHLDSVRWGAVELAADGRLQPRAVAWTTEPVGPTDGRAASAAPRRPGRAPRETALLATDTPQVGEPVLVIAERAAADGSTNLALPLRLIRGVSRLPAIRPGPPGAPGVVGYGAWGERVLPVVDPRALGMATTGPAPTYAVLVVLEALAGGAPASAVPLTSTVGIALLVAGVRGIQRLEHVDASWPADAAFPLALGKTRGRRRADSIAVGATGTDPARDEAGGTPVAVLGAATLENMIARPLASDA